MKLRVALAGCSSAQLARIAGAWALPVEAGTLRRELVELVAARIEAALADAAFWSGLGPTELEILAVLARAGGRHDADLLARRLGRAPRPTIDRRSEGDAGGPASAGPTDASGEVDRSLAALLDRGLVVRAFSVEEQQRGVSLLLPDEVAAAAPDAIGQPGRPATLAPVVEPDDVAVVDLAGDLFVLASALRRECWGAASRGLAGGRPRTADQLVGRLRRGQAAGPGDPTRRWRFLLWIAQRAGWIGRERFPIPADQHVERLLADPDRLPALALAAGPVGGAGDRPEREGRAVARQRQADALQLVSELDPSAWWPADEVVRWLADTVSDDPDSASSGGLPRRDRSIAQLQRWLAGRWFWLGLVAWGRDDAGWSAIRPTAALRALVAGRAAPPRAGGAPCRLGDADRLELIAPADADLPRLYRAERYLALAGGADGGPRRYVLTPASVDRGVRLGGDGAELVDLLERLAHRSLPPSWGTAIARWLDDALRLRFGPALLLSSARPELLAEALAALRGHGLAAEPIGPGHAVVPAGRAAELLAALAEAGHPVEVDAGLRVEPTDVGRAAGLANGVAETAWAALEVLRRLAPDAFDAQRDLVAARLQLDGTLPLATQEALQRRAASIVAALGQRRRPPTRAVRRGVV